MNAELMSLLPKLIELATKAAQFAGSAVDLDGDGSVDADDIALLVMKSSEDWHPRVGGIRVLDDHDTRYAGARFLAGLAIAAVKRKVRKKRRSVNVEKDGE